MEVSDMTIFDKLKSEPITDSTTLRLEGIQSARKVYAPDGSAALLIVGKLSTDTDGLRDPGIQNYESTHQDQITYDSHPPTINSNVIPFGVIPIGMSARHGRQLEMGTLGTVFYNGRHVHIVYADAGPRTKFGEASIAVHRVLGIELVHNGHYTDSGIDSGVTQLIYLGSHLSLPLTVERINAACEPLYAKFVS